MAKVKSQKKRREIAKWRRLKKEAEERVNTRIHERIEELWNDRKFMKKVNGEIEKLNTKDDYDNYVKQAWKLSKGDGDMYEGSAS
jgi:hypothetical protein